MYKLATILLASVLGHLNCIDTITAQTIDDRCEPGGPHVTLEPLTSPVAFLKEGKHLVYKANKESSFLLRCCAREPIKWTFDYNELRRPWEIVGAKIERFATDIFNSKTYDFYVEEELSFPGTAEDHINATFDCQGIESRTVSRVDLKKVNERIDIIAHTSLIQLPLTSQSNEGRMLNHKKENCPFYIHVRASSSGVLDLMCTMRDKQFRPYLFEMRDVMSWENSYRSARRFEQECILTFADTEKCGVGKRCQRYERKVTYNPLVIMCKHGSERRVLKGFFDIDKGYNTNLTFYTDFNDAKQESMIALIEPGNQSDFYHLSTTQFTVKVSQFYFANFTKISIIEADPFATDANSVREYPIDPAIFSTENCLVLTFNYTFQNLDVDALLIVRAPIWNSREWTTLKKDLFIEESYRPTPIIMQIRSDINIDTNVDESGRVTYILQENSDFALMCNSSARPAPNISLIFPRQDITTLVNQFTASEDGFTILSFNFTKVAPFVSGLYECRATNFRGSTSVFFRLKVVESNVTRMTITLVIICTLVLILSALVYVFIKMRHTKKILQEEMKGTIMEFFEGRRQNLHRESDTISELSNRVRSNREARSMDEPMSARYSYNPAIDPFDFNTEEFECFPYNDAYEVAYDKWTKGDKALGAGAHGEVVKGTVQIDGKEVHCAVKTLKSSSNPVHLRDFLSELKIMAGIGKHPNIVNLVAACTQRIRTSVTGEIFIGVELCTNGNLHKYLTSNQYSFHDLVQPDGSMSNGTTFFSQYTNIDKAKINTKDLLRWAHEVAAGMNYLESHKILHGDLAARNVLLTGDLTAKVSDFGLSRQLQESLLYTKKTKCPMPWRWMAIESLRGMTFSSKTDVWSYGIVLWEMFTLGQLPYTGLVWSEEFLDELSRGYRMGKPSFSPTLVYLKMLECWGSDPSKRPSFAELMIFFDSEVAKIILNEP